MNDTISNRLILAEELLRETPGFAHAQIDSIEHLAGDASGRRYSRINLSGGSVPSVILMLLAHGAGPVTAGGEMLNQDDTYVELAGFLEGFCVPVPKLYLDARNRGALLVEDVGDLALWQFAFGKLNQAGEAVRTRLGGDAAVLVLFKRAVDVIATLQAISGDRNAVVFRRSLEKEQYLVEARRFIDHYLLPNGFPASQISVLEAAVDHLCGAVAAHPRRVIHRDFMPWNLHVSPQGEIRVLDFQDALTGSHVYDLVALLHDRDTDTVLGQTRCEQLAAYFKQVMGLGDEFERQYHQVLVQRYLRLAGQFCLLTEKFDNPVYKGWVPGCFLRVGRSLAKLPEYKEAFAILREAVPEIERGACGVWCLNDE